MTSTKALTDYGCRKSIPRGQVIFHLDDEANGFFILESGRVKLYKLSPEGRVVTLDILGPGDIFGAVEWLAGIKRKTVAQAVNDVTLFVCSRLAPEDLFAAVPPVGFDIARGLARRTLRAECQIEDLAFHEVPERLAHLLLDLATRHGIPANGGRQVKIDFRLTHQDIADLIGARRETVSVALGRMKRAGWVNAQGHHLVITDPPKLRTLFVEQGG